MSDINWKWLCKIGAHKYIQVLDDYPALTKDTEWFTHKRILYEVCTRCNKKLQPEYDQFDGTDNA